MKNYKKVFILLLMLCYTSIMCYSQNSNKADVIITKTAQKIEAKVLEVSDDVVKYVKFNNQDGASYIIRTSDIASIQYGNGEIETFQEAISQLQQEELQSNSQISTFTDCGCQVMAMDYPQQITYKQAMEVCPEGWRLPTKWEMECICKYKQLIGGIKRGKFQRYLTGDIVQGKVIRITSDDCKNEKDKLNDKYWVRFVKN